MASLKEIRIRIASVSSTRQITNAMKMVSAAKLRKAQDAIIQLRPYAEKFYEILSTISGNVDSVEDNPYAQEREIQNVLLIVITSNRGLCGASNSNVIKAALHAATEIYPHLLNQNKVHFMPIGKKASDFLTNRHKMHFILV